jgi:hypothetical protein
MRTTTPRIGWITAVGLAAQLAATVFGWSAVAAELDPALAQGAALGLLWGAASLGLGLAAPVAALLVGRRGARLTGALALAACAAACAARAAGLSLFATAAWNFVLGASVALVGPSVAGALSAAAPPRTLRRVDALVVLGYTLGTALVVLVLRPADRPVASLLTAGVLAALAVAWAALVRAGPTLAPPVTSFDVALLLRNRGLRRVAVIQFLLFGSFLSLLGLLCVTRPREQVALWLVAVALGNALGPGVSRQLGLRKPVIIGGALAAGLALGGFAVLGSPALLLATGFASGLVAPLVLGLPLELPYSGAPRVALAVGLIGLGGQLGCLLLAGLAFGALQHSGLTLALLALAGAHLLVPLAAWRLAETGPRSPVPPGQVDFGGTPA